MPIAEASSTRTSAAGQFGREESFQKERAPPKRGQVYCGRKGTLGLPQQGNSVGGGWFLRQRAIATRVLPQNNRCPLFPALSPTARSPPGPAFCYQHQSPSPSRFTATQVEFLRTVRRAGRAIKR